MGRDFFHLQSGKIFSPTKILEELIFVFFWIEGNPPFKDSVKIVVDQNFEKFWMETPGISHNTLYVKSL